MNVHRKSGQPHCTALRGGQAVSPWRKARYTLVTAKIGSSVREPVLAATREPQQGRSRASYERMLAAAGKLLEKHGSADFTLSDIARVGKVSIGSIYLRFDGKEELLNVVHGRLLAELNKTQDAMLDSVVARSSTLREFMEAFVDQFAEMLSKYSSRLRPAMVRAMSDPVVSAVGAGSHDRFAGRVKLALLSYAGEIGRPNPEQAVEFAFRVIYATLARYLGLGSSLEAAKQGDWEALKANLGALSTSYLIAADLASLGNSRATAPPVD